MSTDHRLIRIVVTEAKPGDADVVRAGLTGAEFEIVGYARDGLEGAQMALRLRPDVLVVHETLPELSGFHVAELVCAATTEVGVVLLAQREQEAVLRRAMMAGARDVVALDAPQSRLADVVREVAGLRAVRDGPEFGLVTDPDQMPVSIAITAAKGGVGKTLVAVNLAVLLAQRFRDRVALVDLHGQYGDAALALDIAPHGTIADLCSFDELDPELVQTHLTVHQPSSLRLLAAPLPTPGSDFSPTDIGLPFMASLIGLLRRAYRFVLFDMPPLWPTSQYIISRCQQLLVVANTFDLATIHNTKSLLHLAGESIGEVQRVKLVANRVGGRTEFGPADLRTATGSEIYHQLPEDLANAAGSLNSGRPLVLEAPNSALAKSLVGLADKMTQELATS